jgi:hypothetical protein
VSTAVLKLKHPVEIKNAEGAVIERIDSLTFSRLKGDAFVRVSDASAKGPGQALREMVCSSAQIPPSTFSLLDAEDIAAAADVVSPFFGSGLLTPKT